MFQRAGVVFLLAAATAFSTLAVTDPLISHSSFRSKRAAEFHPGLVKLLDGDVREILSLTGDQTRIGEAEEVGIRNEQVRALELSARQWAELLNASSWAVREWALRTMGERAVDPLPTGKLLALATNAQERIFIRALAVRVLARKPMEAAIAEKLASLAGKSDDIDFERIVMEALGAAAPGTSAVIDVVKTRLGSAEAAIQFEAFNALRALEKGELSATSRDYTRANEVAKLMQTNTVEAAKAGLKLLQERGLPGYVRCVALRSLAYQTNQPGALEALLASAGDRDSFISQLAANVLASLPPLDAEGATTLARAVGNSNEVVRVEALRRLNAAGQNAHGAASAIAGALKRLAREGGSARETGLCLQIARKLGRAAQDVSAHVTELLSETSPVYRDLSKHEVDKIRGMAFATLPETGIPRGALPEIISALANSDENSVHEFGGAARAAGQLGARGWMALPHLLRALDREDTTWSTWIALEEFDTHASASAAYTTPQVEALRAIADLGANDRATMRMIRELAREGQDFDGIDAGAAIPSAQAEATKALARLSGLGAVHQAGVRLPSGE